jgi:GTP-binding protein Era
MGYKSGFVSILGRPNVGKSTLINYLLGEKISIVTPKPQTTRHKITCIFTNEKGQIIFLDTPGLHKGKKELNKAMMEQTLSAIKDNDLVIFLTDVSKNNFQKDSEYFELFKNLKVLLFINKVDLINRLELLPMIEQYNSTGIFKEILPISLTKGENCDKIVDLIFKYLPDGPQYYPEDILSTENERFIISEIIREKVFLQTKEEVPYSIGVLIDYFKEDEKLVKIGATIIVERDSQKGIIIGKKGSMLKKIGTLAREEIERFLNKKVFLELFVKVVKNWTKDPKKVKEIFKE